MSEEQPTRNALERHFQTLVGAVALALLFWIFSSVQELNITVARQSEQIVELANKVAAGTNERYRISDAIRDFADRDRRLDRLETRVEKLEKLN